MFGLTNRLGNRAAKVFSSVSMEEYWDIKSDLAGLDLIRLRRAARLNPTFIRLRIRTGYADTISALSVQFLFYLGSRL